MILSGEGLKNRDEWEMRGYRLPAFDRDRMIEKTLMSPAWLHFGPGNIFKAFLADACQRLLDAGLCETGIIAVGRREHKPGPDDNLTVKVTLKADGKVEKAVIASIAETVCLYGGEERLRDIFENAALRMVSFTITEKGYALYDAHGRLLPDISEDLAGTPESAKSYMGKITALLRARYQKNKAPLAMVSMDNCSHNGDVLKAAVTCFAKAWGDEGFCHWLEESVSFPWTMIDKITPAPDASVAAMLAEDTLPAGTPFVNAEESEYLVIEDHFPNGRPCLERAGVLKFTDRRTVDLAERMKVCTCLNPLHTALAVFGCLLGYERIWQEMQDEDLRKMVEIIGYKEGLPVVSDPGIISPRDFIDTVVKVRIPNPFIPDTPWRIATDTSKKLPIRFGGTIRAYLASDTLDVNDLRLIPFVFAGWLRYLMAVDDTGKAFEPSPDPQLAAVRAYVSGYTLGDTPDAEALKPLMRNANIFGVDLVGAGLSGKVIGYYKEMMAGVGAVRAALHRTVTEGSI